MNPWQQLLAMNQPQQQQTPSLLLDPEAQFAAEQGMPFPPQQQMPPQAPNSPMVQRSPQRAPNYSQQFDDAFKGSMDNRKAMLEKLQAKLAMEEGNKPQGLDAMNLRPFLAFADQMAGTNSAAMYQAPNAKAEHEAKLAKLQEQVYGGSDKVADDELAYLKMKATEQMANQRMGTGFDRTQTNNEFKLRNEWDSDPITKNTKAMSEGYQKIAGAQAGGGKASDLSLIYGIMRLQDPGSVVREREADMAAAIGGFPAQTQAWFNRLKGTGNLTPEQRAEIVREAEGLWQSQQQRQNEVDKTYTDVAQQYGFAPERVVLSKIFNNAPKSGTKAPGKMGKADQDALAWASANPNDPRAKAIKQKLGAK